jgi:hypothetical protein
VVRFLALSDFLRSSGSETGSTQPREYNWGAAWKKSSGSGLESREYGRGDPLRWRRDTLYPQKLALTSPTSCSRSVGLLLADSGNGDQWGMKLCATYIWLTFSPLHYECSAPEHVTLLGWVGCILLRYNEMGDFCCTIHATYKFCVISYYTFFHNMFRLLLSHLQVRL